MQLVVNMSPTGTGLKPWKALCAMVRTFTLPLGKVKNHRKALSREAIGSDLVLIGLCNIETRLKMLKGRSTNSIWRFEQIMEQKTMGHANRAIVLKMVKSGRILGVF